MVDTELLEKKIADSGKTKTYLCKKIGCSLQSFRLKSINRYDFKMSEVSTLCNELNITSLKEKEKIFNANVDKMTTQG